MVDGLDRIVFVQIFMNLEPTLNPGKWDQHRSCQSIQWQDLTHTRMHVTVFLPNDVVEHATCSFESCSLAHVKE